MSSAASPSQQPYYEDGAVTLYHGDCRDFDLSADVLITDPPYGVAFGGKATKHTSIRPGGYTTKDDSEIGPAVLRRMLPSMTRAAVFPGNRLLHSYPEPSDIGCVYCPSGAGIGRWGFTCFHPILFYGPRASTRLRPTSMQSFATAEQCDHPCPKPLSWLAWLVELASERGEVIIDPFAGSGTTLRAAKNAGRRSIGIELEERYCEIAALRMGQEVLDLAV